MKCTYEHTALVHECRGQVLTPRTTVPVIFVWLETLQGFEEGVHLTRHDFEVDGQSMVLLDDVRVVYLDQRVAQIRGRSELQ